MTYDKFKSEMEGAFSRFGAAIEFTLTEGKDFRVHGPGPEVQKAMVLMRGVHTHHLVRHGGNRRQAYLEYMYF